MGSIHYDRYFRVRAGLANLDLANRNFRQALALEPDNGGATRGLILVHHEISENESSLVIARQVSQSGVGLDNLLIPAWAYSLGSSPNAALPLLEQAIRLDPRSDEAYWLLTLAATWSGEFARAVKAGEEYVQAFGGDPEIHLWLGVSYRGLGNAALATKNFERAIELYTDDTQLYVSLLVGAHFDELGNRQRATGIWKSAIVVAEARRLVAPDNLRLRTILASLYGRVGNAERFKEELDALIDIKARGYYEFFLAAYAPSSMEEVAADAILERHGPTAGLWWWPLAQRDYSLFPGTNDLFVTNPRIRARALEYESHESSLRQKYGLAPRPSRESGS
jgi:tetratricopeptide (TPR) repeat protein